MSTRLLGSVAALALTASLQFGSAQATPLTTGAGLAGHDDTTLVHSIRYRGHYHHHHHGRRGHRHHR